jgi:hypothetical protein
VVPLAAVPMGSALLALVLERARPSPVALLAHHAAFRAVPASFHSPNQRVSDHTFPNVICAMGRRRVVKEQDQC